MHGSRHRSSPEDGKRHLQRCQASQEKLGLVMRLACGGILVKRRRMQIVSRHRVGGIDSGEGA